MQSDQGSLRHFWNELMRRRVVRSLAAYAAAAFVLLQAADLILSALDASPRILRLLVILTLTGAPIVAALSWIFEYSGGKLVRDARSNVGPGRVAIAALVALIFLSTGWYGIERPYRSVDDKLIAVMPFTVSGTGSDLATFGDGMVDLISTKLQAGTQIPVVDPTTLLISWHKRYREGERVSLEAMKRFAVANRAGRVLSGTIIVAGKHVVLNGYLSPIGLGHHVTHSVEGSSDSITWLADRLTESLLSLDAGESETHLAQLTSTSLPALQRYLAGKALFRQGSFRAAMREFAAAVDLDSTFALAGLSFASPAGWVSGLEDDGHMAEARARARRAAFAGRARLDRVDQNVFVGLYGDGPAPTHAQQCNGWSRAHALAPERLEITHYDADCTFHYGRVFGIKDWEQRAKQGFVQSLGPDSAFTPSLHHLLEIAVDEHDSAAAEHWGRLARASTGAEDRPFVEWQIALGTRDKLRLRELAAHVDTGLFIRVNFLENAIADQSEYVDALLRESARRAAAGTLSEGVNDNQQIVFAFARGRPAEAYKYMQHRAQQTTTYDADEQFLRYSMYDDVDSVRTLAAAARVRKDAALEAPAAGTGQFRSWMSSACTIAEWDLWHRKVASADELNRKLRNVSEARGYSPANVASARLCADVIAAVRTWSMNAPNAHAAALHLDSISAQGPRAGYARTLRFIAARLLEESGDITNARTALERTVHYTDIDPNLSTHLRLAGRLAERNGDRAAAADYYKQYLALRSHEEPAGQKQSDVVRAALARIAGEPQH